jgi:hypothetical protein
MATAVTKSTGKLPAAKPAAANADGKTAEEERKKRTIT